MQLDKGRLFVLIVAAVSIGVWLIVFPLVLIRGPAGAFSGEDSGALCIAGGEAHADHDIVRFVRRFHYLGVRSEVKTGAQGDLCFLISFARRIPEVADAVLRKGELRVYTLHPNQSLLFEGGAAQAAGLTQRSEPMGPQWVSTSTAAINQLIDTVRDRLPGPAFSYCQGPLCTALLMDGDPVVKPDDVMAAFPIKSEAGYPALLLRLVPPVLQKITALAGGPPPREEVSDSSKSTDPLAEAAPSANPRRVTLAFIVDDRLLSVAAVPAPKADGQITVPLDRSQKDIEFEAAVLAALLTSRPLEGQWVRTELRLSPAPTEP